MRSLILAVAIFVSSIAVSGLAASEPTLSVVARAHAPLEPGLPIFFADEPARFVVSLELNPAIDASEPPAGALQLPPAWWEDFKFVTRKDGEGFVPGPVTFKVSHREARRTVKSDRPAHIPVAIGVLPIGKYQLDVSHVAFRGLRGTAYFEVRTGNENESTRRLYLRALLARTDVYSEQKSLLLQLTKLEPASVGHWETLGEITLAKGTVAESLTYFGEALKRLGRKSSTSARRSRAIQRLETLLRTLSNRRDTSRTALEVEWLDGEKRYKLRDKKTGQLIKE